MKLWTVRYDRHWFFTSLIIFISTIVGYGFYSEDLSASLFNPALGFFFLFVLINGNKAYLWFIPSVLLGHFIMRYFYFDSGVLLSFILAATLSVILYSQVAILNYLRVQLKLTQLFHYFVPFTILLGILSVVLVSLVGAYITTVVYILAGLVQSQLITVFTTQFTGNFFGIMLIVISGYWSYLDDPYTRSVSSLKTSLINFGLLVVFGLLALFITQGWFVFNFGRDYYIMFIVYMIFGLRFNYRIIAKFNVFFLFVSSVNLQAVSSNYLLAMITLCFFIGTATLLALLIKRFIDLRRKQIKSIEEKNQSVDALLTDIYELLNFSGELIDHMKSDHYDRYLMQTLDIALNLIKDADAGYCYIESSGTINVLNTKHYKTHLIPYIYETHDLFIRDDVMMRVFQDVKGELKRLYGKQYGELVKETYPMKRRVMMKFDYQKDQTFIVVIDKFKRSDVFTSDQDRQTNQFVKLLNSLFKRNYTMSRNMVLKNDIILHFVQTLDLFDAYTKGHSDDVSKFVMLFGEALNLNEDDLEALYWAGILHDIGKIGISSTILNKPGRLTDDEYQTVKDHAKYGYEVLNKAESLKPIAKLVKHHHEWWNGLGYPDQLKEDAIPLGSLIIAVADMISTMATDRTYRKRQTKNTIVNELIRYRGTQFSPKVVDVALKLIDEGLLENHYGRSF